MMVVETAARRRYQLRTLLTVSLWWATAAIAESPLHEVFSTSPADLDAGQWEEKLPSEWQTWVAGLSDKFSTLYTDLSSEELAARLGEVDKKLSDVSKFLGDDRYKSLHPAMLEFHRRFVRRFDLIKAVDGVLANDPHAVFMESRDRAKADIEVKMAELESFLAARKGLAWLDYMRATELKDALKANDADLPGYLAMTVTQIQRARNMADPQQKNFLSAEEFLALERVGTDYLDLAVKEPPMVTSAQLIEPLQRLVSRVEAYESTSHSQNISEMESALADLKRILPVGLEPLEEVVHSHYFNHNVRIVATEAFLSRLVKHKEPVRREPIKEMVGGAYLQGTQSSSAETSVDLKDNKVPNSVVMDLMLKGLVNTDTQASKNASANGRSVNVWARIGGNHRFVARKRAVITLESLSTSPATIDVNANNSVLGVDTDWRGFGAGQAQSRASEGVWQSIPEANAQVSTEIRNRVLPEFEEEAEKSLAKLKTKIEENRDNFRNARITSDHRFIASNESYLVANARVRRDGELGGDMTSPERPGQHGLLVQIHESFFNNLIDRVNLKGRKLAQAELNRELEAFFKPLVGDWFTFKTAQVETDEAISQNVLELSPTDPIRFRFADGMISILIESRFARADKEPLPLKRVTVPLEISLSGEKILQVRGSVKVESLDHEDQGTGRLIGEAVALRRHFEAAIKDDERDRKVVMDRGEGEEKVSMRVNKLTLHDGWLTIGLD